MRTSKLGSLLALSVLLAVTAHAESSDAKKDDPCKTIDGKKTAACSEKAAKPAAQKSMSFSNDDLERLFGESTAPPTPVAKGAAKDAAAQPGAPGASTPEQAASVVVLKTKLDEAQQKLKDLEARKIQIANPLQPRPKLTPEEEKSWANMDNVARMKANEDAIEQAKRDIEQARLDLAKAKAGGQ